MKFSDWLKQADCLLHVTVTRYLGQWGYECVIIRQRKEADVKDTLLYLVTGSLNEQGEVPKYPFRNILGFGVEKFPALQALVKKVAGKALCYMEAGKGHVLVEVPGQLEVGNREDYVGLVKSDDPTQWD